MEKKRLRFVLCGSSARKLKRAGVNLLAGRALNRSMHPFVPEEIGQQQLIAVSQNPGKISLEKIFRPEKAFLFSMKFINILVGVRSLRGCLIKEDTN